MPGLTSGFAMSSAFRLIQIGGKSWTAGVKASGLGVHTWSRRAPTATRTKPRDRSSIRWTPSAITATSHEPGRSSSSTTRTASLKRTYVWAILGALAQTRSNILKAGTGFDAQKQFQPTSKMQLLLQSTSPAASLATRRRCNTPLRRRIASSG